MRFIEYGWAFNIKEIVLVCHSETFVELVAMWFMAPGLIKKGRVLDHLSSHKLIKKDPASRNYWS